MGHLGIYATCLLCIAVLPSSSLLASIFTEFVGGKFYNECSSSQYKCADGSCIDLNARCNSYKDCPDGSDERNCSAVPCGTGYFRCNSSGGECIHNSSICNGVRDCPDNSDEENCRTQYKKLNCTNNEFKCDNDDCIPLNWYCDGQIDCMDKSDEPKLCKKSQLTCTDGEFMCKNRHCIAKIFRCDFENDCQDNSDEEDCPPAKINLTDCTLEKRKYACKDEYKCLDIRKVCDGIRHCFDGSDEGGHCLTVAERDHCKMLNCSHECVLTPKEAVCICPPGTSANRENNCDDIDECKIYGTCDQNCENSYGSYTCSCEPGYYLQSDGHTCKAAGMEGLLLYSSLREVKSLLLESHINYTIADQLLHTTGVASDGQFIYWTVIHDGSQAIVKSTKDGIQQEMIVTSGLGAPEDLDVDWVTTNIYFTDAKMKHIGVCTNDGRTCTVLHNKDIDKPRAIALVPERGIMFWTDWGSNPLICRSNMDGSNPIEFVSENLHWPNGVTVDLPTESIYWVDAKLQTIERIKFDGTDRRVVLRDSVKHPFAISVFENMLYWSDWDGREILACNKFTGKDRHSVIREINRRIYGIHIYHNILQMPKFENPCKNAKCSDICLLKPLSKFNITYTCACPDDKELSNDGKTCHDLNIAQTLVASYRNHLYVIEHEHVGRPKVSKIPLGDRIKSVTALIYNTVSNSVILNDAQSLSLYSYDLKSSTLKTIVEHGLGHIHSIDFDDYGNNLYWCDWDSLTIESLSLTTFKQTTIVTGSSTEAPVSFALIPEEGTMFVVLVLSFAHVHIDLMTMDGNLTHRFHVVEADLIGPEVSLHYNRDLKRVFWVDLTTGRIESVNTYGIDRQSFTQTNGPIQITSLNRDIFWITKESQFIFWQSDDKEKFTKSLKLDIEGFNFDEELRITSVSKIDARSLNHPCHRNNGDCSDLCLPSHISNTRVCACPNGKSLTPNGTHCINSKNCSPHEYRCVTGECIPLSRTCNGFGDCPHADDELPGNCDHADCPTGQFLCADKKKCIDNSLVCDGKFDCSDNSDEKCHVKCNKDQFLCNNGDCIENHFRCDRKSDCKTGEDEYNCTMATCSTDEFRCKSGQCISKNWECDGDIDCTDGSDERNNCPQLVCTSKEFHCTNGRCVDIILTCNGHDDCGDNSDEGGKCSDSMKLNQQSVFYFISTHDGKYHKLCNSVSEFYCGINGTHCLPMSARCNGSHECPNYADEANCKDGGCPHDNEFMCARTKHCIPHEWLCDGTDDCHDNSDEDPTMCSSISKKSFSDNICDGFQCNNGECIPESEVCNGVQTCKDNSDEGGKCEMECTKSSCSQKCHRSPSGPKCSCNNGYVMHADNKTCVDIDECGLEICSQKCTNTNGSFICSCLEPNYILKSDRVSCKANGIPMRYVILSEHSILTISHDLQRTDLIYSNSNRPRINSIDVDDRRNYVYWASSAGFIARTLLEPLSTTYYVSDLESPTKIVIDWITFNAYYVEGYNKIALCNFDGKKCLKVYTTQKEFKISSLAIDPPAGYLFWYELKYTDVLTPIGVIKRADCSGLNVQNITQPISSFIDDIQVDSIQQELYYLNRYKNTIERMSYDGKNQYTILKVDEGATSFAYFENALYWSTGDNSDYELRKCKVRGLPPRKCEMIQVKTPVIDYFTIQQDNKHRIVDNPCLKRNCTHVCTMSPTGVVCLCPNGESGEICRISNNNQTQLSEMKTDEVAELSTEKKIGYSVYFAYFTIVCLIIGVLLFTFIRFYKPKSPIFHKLHFENPIYDNAAANDNLHIVQHSQLIPGEHSYENPLTQNPKVTFLNEMNIRRGEGHGYPSGHEEVSDSEYMVISQESSKAPLIIQGGHITNSG